MKENCVINGDCLIELKNYDDDYFNMVYIDPPFFKQYKLKMNDRNGNVHQFDDVWLSREDYNIYIKKRLIELRRVLKKDGLFFLHCDDSASHHLRLICDEVFGEDNFRSEIIWSYKRWSNSKKGLLPAHQSIYMYSKNKTFKFNTLYTDYSLTTNVDQILQERSRDEFNKSVYKTDAEGKPVMCSQKNGVPLSDVWNIPYLNPKAKERVGYPTQKPVELLDKIISISTDENDIVLDAFCGSGTTLVSAKMLNRRYVGIDINKDAVEISNTRLSNPIKTDSMLLKNGINSYDKQDSEVKKVLSMFDCINVQRNKGIDAFISYDGVNGMIPIKISSKPSSLFSDLGLLENAAFKKSSPLSILISLGDSEYEVHNKTIITPLKMVVNEGLRNIVFNSGLV